jgi:hypothetical protein
MKHKASAAILFLAATCTATTKAFAVDAPQNQKSTKDVLQKWCPSGDCGRGRANAEPTALGIPTLDTDLINKLVKQRVRESIAEGVRKSIRKEVLTDDLRVADDFADALVGLIWSDAKVASRSQVVALAFVRAGLTALTEEAFSSRLATCTDSAAANDSIQNRKARLNAVYEGLAASRAVGRLGFTAATGIDQIKEPGCKAVAVTVRDFADITVLRSLLPTKAPTDLKNSNATLTCIDPKDETKVKEALSKIADPTARNRAQKLFTIMSASGSGSTIDTALDASNSAINLLTQNTAAAFDACTDQFASYATASSTLSTLSSQGLGGERVEDVKNVLELVSNSCTSEDCSLATEIISRTLGKSGLRRGDFVVFGKKIALAMQPFVNLKKDSFTRLIIDELPNAINDPGNAPSTVDATSLSAAILRKADLDRSTGLYLRATVGAGYIAQEVSVGGEAAAPAAYEELGVGYRWSASADVRHGPHFVASGLIHRITQNKVARDGIFVGPGWSLNIARIIDISANVGLMSNARDEAEQARGPYGAALIGLQLPLVDYLDAIANQNSSVESKSEASTSRNQ